MQHDTEHTRQRQAAEDLFGQGMELWWRGARAAACARFRAALKRWPAHVDALNQLGIAAKDRGRLADAARFFQGALEAGASTLDLEDGRAEWGRLGNRPYLRALGNLGLVRSRQRRHQEALVIYERALALNPNDNQGVRYLLGEQHHRLRQLSEAIVAYTNAGDEPGCQYGLALALHQAGRAHERDAALLRAFAGNRYIAPMLLGLPWARVEGFHGTNMSDTEWASDYVAQSGDLWRKDKSAGAVLRAWWTAGPVRAWLDALAQCMVTLASRELDAERSAAIARRDDLESPARLALLQLEVQGGWTPDAG